MSDACKAHYLQLHGRCGAVLDLTFEGERAATMAKSHAFVADLTLWISELATRPEAVALKAAQREYQFALLALTFGQYRAAFVALRLTLELCFATVQWSSNERELREWKRGERDCVWTKLIDKENGVLSKQFVRLFSEPFADAAAGYRGTAEGVYRECSEYVHGNAETHVSLPEGVAFDAGSFDKWQEKCGVICLAMSFCLAARYLTDMDATARSRVETMILDHLGHLPFVRTLYGGSVEVESV
jgi:hypothetical protein